MSSLGPIPQISTPEPEKMQGVGRTKQLITGDKSKQSPVKMFGVFEKGLVEKSKGPRMAVNAVNMSEVITPCILLSLKSMATIRGRGPAT